MYVVLLIYGGIDYVFVFDWYMNFKQVVGQMYVFFFFDFGNYFELIMLFEIYYCFVVDVFVWKCVMMLMLKIGDVFMNLVCLFFYCGVDG